MTPPNQGGNGIVREAVHTKYAVVEVPTPPSRLRAGANTLPLFQESRGDASDVMDDAVRLELR